MIIVVLIFLLFALRIFVSTPFILNSIPYLLILLIIANIAFLFINKTKGLFVNILLLGLSLLLFVFLVEYLASIAGAVLGFFHALKIFFRYRKGRDKPKEEKEIKEKIKEEKKGK